MLVFYIPWKYFRQSCCLDIIIFYSIPNCSQCGFWLEHHAGRNTMKWNRNLSMESCQSRIHSAGTDRMDLPINYILFLLFCDHKALRCPASVEFKAFEFLLWEKMAKKKKNLDHNQSVEMKFWVLSMLIGIILVLFMPFLRSLVVAWVEQGGDSFIAVSKENPEFLQLVEKNHPWILQRVFSVLPPTARLGAMG